MKVEDEQAPRTVTERLAAFVVDQLQSGVPVPVLREAKRLLLNGLRASVGAHDQEAIRILRSWADASRPSGRLAHVAWSGTPATSEIVALVDAAQWFYLLLDECHLGSGTHPAGTAAGAALAEGERLGRSGREVLTALALGTEIHLVIASILMPKMRLDRGFAPIVPGAIGAAVAASALNQLDRDQTTNALAVAMLNSVGLWEMSGTMASYYTFGEGARAGVVAAQLAAQGIDGPHTAFEGENGMLRAFSGESMDKVETTLAQLGERWHMLELSYQRYAGDTVTQAPLDCTLEIRKRVSDERRQKLDRLIFWVDPLTIDVAETRRRKFGRPRTPLQANSDPRYCIAAAWVAGRYTAAEKHEPFLTDEDVMSLRESIHMESQGGSLTSRQFQRARCRAEFSDGSVEEAEVDAFRGDFRNPMGDSDLEDLFRQAAGPWMGQDRIERIVEVVQSLEEIEDIRDVLEDVRVEKKSG